MILKDDHLIKVNDGVASLEKKISNDEIGESIFWQGADVVISVIQPELPDQSFYPLPRFVITPFAKNLSWLFEELRDLFINLEGYGYWKEEFFGRLANAANRQIEKKKQIPKIDLLLSITHESFCIIEEMNEGEFTVLPIAFGNEIYDDLIYRSQNDGLMTIEATQDLFRKREIE